MSVNGSCPYCGTGDSDYDIDCHGCRARFRFDHVGRFATSKKLEYELRMGTTILEVREEQEE